MRKSVAVSTLLSIIFTIVLTLICCLLAHQILRWMQIPEDISGEAYDYMFVVLLGTGATVFYCTPNYRETDSKMRFWYCCL